MSCKYSRTTEKAKWNSEQLESAMNAIENGRKVREVARSFGIPRSTLRKRRSTGDFSNPSLGRKPLVSKNQETDFCC